MLPGRLLQKAFSRLKVASFDYPQVTRLAEQCVSAINYWKGKAAGRKLESGRYALTKLRVFIEILARISVCLPPEKARELFIFAADLSKHSALQDLWIKDALDNLLSYSMESVPDSEQASLLPHALDIPLPHEAGFENFSGWPNPVVETPGARPKHTAIDRRIAEIINSVSKERKNVTSALIRLIPLTEGSYVTQAERETLLTRLWGSDPANPALQMPNELFAHALLKLPSYDPQKLRDELSINLFEAAVENLFEPSLMENIINSTMSSTADLSPSPTQAMRYLDVLTSWRPKPESQLEMAFSHGGERRKASLIGRMLGFVVTPNLEGEHTESMFAQLEAFYLEVQSPATLRALIYFTDKVYLATNVEKTLRLALQHKDGRFVAHAAFAIREWRARSDDASVRRLVNQLVLIFGAHRFDALPAIIESLKVLCEQDHLSTEQMESIIDTLPVVFESARYEAVVNSGHEAASISIVRTKCAQLASFLASQPGGPYEDLQRILSEAGNDPLPEVRFANA